MADIKSKIENNIESAGMVTVTAIQNGKVIQKIVNHNEGTVELCKYLRDACIGQNVIGNRPGRIIPCSLDTSQPHNLKKLFSYGIQYQAEGDKKQDYSNYAVAIIKFLIPYTLLASQSTIHGFYLCADNSALTEYAWIEMPEDIIVKKDTNVLVEWKLKLSYVES